MDFGAKTSLCLIVALYLVRELEPLLSALLFAGRAGSALTTEIGLMKAIEQLAAMEIVAVDLMTCIIEPRLMAGISSVPLIAALLSAVGVLGGYLVGLTSLASTVAFTGLRCRTV